MAQFLPVCLLLGPCGPASVRSQFRSEEAKLKNVQYAILTAVLAAVAVAGCRSGTGPGAPPANRPASQQQSVEPPKPKKEFIEARGVYLTGWSSGGKQKMQKIVELLKATGMNAVVIDVKDSDGAITFKMDIPWANQIEAKRGQIKEINHYGYAQRCADIDWVMNLLKENNIYPIARIAVFADDILPRVRPDMAAKNASGGIWENRKKEAWLDPYNREGWDYNAAVAIEAMKKGFKEIQWDYVRFPTDGKLGNLRFPAKTDTPPNEVIAQYLAYTRKKLEPYGAIVSADIFGLTGLVSNDMGIGQLIHQIAENVDYICPMVYPSHYHKGEYGIPNPDAAPYDIVYVSLRDAQKRLAGTGCKIRPWLQNFSLPDRGRYGGSHYGPPQIAAQIKATYDRGIPEFLMWDPKNRFNGLEGAMASLAQKGVKPRPTPPDDLKPAPKAPENAPAQPASNAPANAPARR
jgi:hypothetical protein